MVLSGVPMTVLPEETHETRAHSPITGGGAFHARLRSGRIRGDGLLDFLALSADEQMEAMATAQLGEEAEPAESSAPDEEVAAAVVAGCTEHSDMMLGDVMAEAMGD